MVGRKDAAPLGKWTLLVRALRWSGLSNTSITPSLCEVGKFKKYEKFKAGEGLKSVRPINEKYIVRNVKLEVKRELYEKVVLPT